MCIYGDGTACRRSLGSGIVYLAWIGHHGHADPDYHLSPSCKKEQRDLEERFKYEICNPWLRKNRLEADISLIAWQSRRVQGESSGFPRLTFQENADISVVRRIALFQVARSSDAWGFKQFFGLVEPRQRWWVLDFYLHGTSRQTYDRT